MLKNLARFQIISLSSAACAAARRDKKISSDISLCVFSN